jgi:hypothetical protein
MRSRAEPALQLLSRFPSWPEPENSMFGDAEAYDRLWLRLGSHLGLRLGHADAPGILGCRRDGPSNR